MLILYARRIKLNIVVFLTLLMMSLSVLPLDIYHMNINNEKDQLILQVLKLALSKSQEKYQYIESSNLNANLVRNKSKLKKGTLSVLWAGTSYTLENDLRAIKIPVLKGMLGHRLMIIRKNDQEKFLKIKQISNLTQLTAGQGTFWEDAQILRINGIPIVTTTKYQNLFAMLAGGRFDFFPRALHEPWVELKNYPQFDLIVEDSILLVYPFAMYFFVAPDSEKLAQQIEIGFNRAIEDGSFDQLFFSNPMIKGALGKAELSGRRVFYLENPNMSSDASTSNKNYWLDLDGLKANTEQPH